MRIKSNVAHSWCKKKKKKPCADWINDVSDRFLLCRGWPPSLGILWGRRRLSGRDALPPPRSSSAGPRRRETSGWWPEAHWHSDRDDSGKKWEICYDLWWLLILCEHRLSMSLPKPPKKELLLFFLINTYLSIYVVILNSISIYNIRVSHRHSCKHR